MKTITVETSVTAPVKKVWSFFTEPARIIQWNHASDDWHSPNAMNDLKAGGKFNVRMEAKDGSDGFDFAGTYDEIIPHKLIRYTVDDGRKVGVMFEEQGGVTHLTETFDPENENTHEVQRSGWQAILDNFKKYVEAR